MKREYILKFSRKELADFEELTKIVANDLINKPTTVLAGVVFAELSLIAFRKLSNVKDKQKIKVCASQAVALFQTLNWYHLDNEVLEQMTYDIVGQLDKQEIKDLK